MGKQLIVVGGGAAGFFCAINAAQMDTGLKVTIVEKGLKLLSKVRVSGGGRCNVTHACFDPDEMSRRYPRGRNFVKKCFHQFFTTDTIAWFKQRGVELKTEPDGRMFPTTDSSQTIIDCLIREANRLSIEIIMRSEVLSVSQTNDEKFIVELSNERKIPADLVCVACGGYPKTEMFNWLKTTGHSIEAPVPSLFTFNIPGNPINDLMGVSVEDVKVKIEGTRLQESGPLLITHWGLSGPAILKLSAWGARELQSLNYEFSVHINWVHKKKMDEASVRRTFDELRGFNGKEKVAAKNFSELPQRLWLFLLEISGINREMRFADCPKRNENLLIKNLTDHTLEVKGKTTFKEEFVTAGGIMLQEVDANTMMSKKINRLFFAGEILNVDGITGGYNFQHAWTSAWIAAKAIASLATGDPTEI
jgi:predicted Rossmann fold flavoprotein